MPVNGFLAPNVSCRAKRPEAKWQLNSINHLMLDSLLSNWQQLVSKSVFGPDTGHVHLEPGTIRCC